MTTELVHAEVLLPGTTVLVPETGEVQVPDGQVALAIHTPTQHATITLIDTPQTLHTTLHGLGGALVSAERQLRVGGR